MGRLQLPCPLQSLTIESLSRSKASCTDSGIGGTHRWLTVTVDDDGPGIPVALREDVFKPFLRLDDARNQDEGGSGLGLAIARDIARSHGGDIMLGDSPMGGLRAAVRIPV